MVISYNHSWKKVALTEAQEELQLDIAVDKLPNIKAKMMSDLKEVSHKVSWCMGKLTSCVTGQYV